MYNNYQVKEFIDSFLIQAIQPLTSILKIAGHNRARQRDKWGHLLDDFGVLQDEVSWPTVFLIKNTISQSINLNILMSKLIKNHV